MNNMIEDLKIARRASAPVVAISTPYQAATIDEVTSNSKELNISVLISWNEVQGFVAINEAAEKWVKANKLDSEKTSNPMVALEEGSTLPEYSVFFIENAHRFLDRSEVSQAILSLVNIFKGKKITLVLLGPSFSFPQELRQIYVNISEELPGKEALEALGIDIYKCIKSDDAQLKPEELEHVKEMSTQLTGLSYFAAEQVLAMSLNKTGYDSDKLRKYKRNQFEQVKGIFYQKDTCSFDDIAGLSNIKNFLTSVCKGRRKPRLIIRMEELEKCLAGSKNDTTGISQDFLQNLLTEIEDNEWFPVLCYGIAGTGKSFIAKSTANTFDIECLTQDLNAAKGSLVGESEQNIREQMKLLRTIGGKDILFIASCNAVDTIDDALISRFKGIFFFDLPDQEEREKIWDLNLKKYSLDIKPHVNLLNQELSGRDIRDICELSSITGWSLEEARTYKIPLVQQNKDAIERIRNSASRRFLSASYPGDYVYSPRDVAKPSQAPLTRKIDFK